MMSNRSSLTNPQRTRPAVPAVPPLWKAGSITRSKTFLRLVRKLFHVSCMYFLACYLHSDKFWSVSVMAVAGTMKYSQTSEDSTHGSVKYSAKTTGDIM